jgi:FixJ family two-component response regulator
LGSRHIRRSIRTQMLRAGAIGFLSKPFNGECLIDCLTTALSREWRDTEH